MLLISGLLAMQHNGAAVYSASRATEIRIKSSTFSANQAQREGMLFFKYSTKLSLESSTFKNNCAVPSLWIVMLY